MTATAFDRFGVTVVEPKIEDVPRMRLVGIGRRMSLAADSTVDLWRALMSRRAEIANRASTDYCSMRIYDDIGMPLGDLFAPSNEFEKWAAVEVTDHGAIPDGLQPYTLEGGTYAVFVHKGPADRFPDTMRFILGVWLPKSGFELDHREQFEIVPEDWRPDDEDAEERVFIPIRRASLG